MTASMRQHRNGRMKLRRINKTSIALAERNGQVTKATVEINPVYLKEAIKKVGKTAAQVSREMGLDGNYLSASFNRKTMSDTTLRFLCTLIGADYKTATTMEDKKPKEPQVGGVTSDELKELTEIVISYIQELGKIESDIIRELRELRTLQKEQGEKLNKTAHELDVFIRNEGAESRSFHKTVNNYLSGISSCMKLR